MKAVNGGSNSFLDPLQCLWTSLGPRNTLDCLDLIDGASLFYHTTMRVLT